MNGNAPIPIPEEAQFEPIGTQEFKSVVSAATRAMAIFSHCTPAPDDHRLKLAILVGLATSAKLRGHQIREDPGLPSYFYCVDVPLEDTIKHGFPVYFNNMVSLQTFIQEEL